MIEVEKKFILNENDKNRLINGAEFLTEKIFTDIYYDTNDFTLTSKDKWLRSREGKFELKLPLHPGAERLVDQYNEIEDELEIKKALNLGAENSLIGSLKENGYAPFCVCKTMRKKYRKGSFNIDLDIVDFQNFTYLIEEIELMVDRESEIKNAINRIMIFAEENNLKIVPARGKVIEYLKRVKPEHYRVLVEARVVKDV